jgi:hypothetical protein
MSGKKNQSSQHTFIFVLDLFMIFLVVIDLLFIGFNALFEVKIFRESLLMSISPSFTNWYDEHIRQNFLFFESSIFVSIFLVELFLRWLFAIIQRTYEKWFFYPVYHWYDVLGCIPTSSFRILRFIRVFVLLYKLHKWKVINLNDYILYRKLIHYYNIIVEEISDKVAVNLLEEAKSEINQGEPLAKVLVRDLIKPNRKEITDWAAYQIRRGINKQYSSHRKEIQLYLKSIIKESVEANKEIHNLEKIPVLGSIISESIYKAVADISFGVIDRISSDLASEEKSAITDAIVNAVLDLIFTAEEQASHEQKQLANKIVSDAVDLIISRVREKKWKLAETRENDLKEIFE